jgi:hypothetical protein
MIAVSPRPEEPLPLSAALDESLSALTVGERKVGAKRPFRGLGAIEDRRELILNPVAPST